MPSLSIIVPVYKVEKYLSRCIDSILNQSFSDFELILVDDGSPDKCGFICDQYAKQDTRVKVIHKENGGLSSARNAGLDIATGEYIGFVDGDDYINKEMYSILYKEIVKSNSDIVICNYTNVYEDNYKDINEEINIKYKCSFNNIEAIDELYKMKKIEFIVAWNKLYKKSVFECIKYEEGRLHEDEFIIHKLLYKSKKVVYIDCELYYYMQRSNSIMGERFNIKRMDIIYALEDRITFFRENHLDEFIDKSEYEYINCHFRYYYRCKVELSNCKKELKELRSIFLRNILFLLNNSLFNWKEKLKWIIFCISPCLYQMYYEFRGFKLY